MSATDPEAQRPPLDGKQKRLDLAQAIQALTTVLDAKTPNSKHFLLEGLTQLGTLLTAATLVGMIGKTFGASDDQTAGFSLFVILALYAVIYREAIQKIIKVYVILICLLSGGLIAVLFKDQLRSALISQSLSSATGIIEYTPKANDFLPSLAKYISGAKQEIWFTGISFYVTLPQHRNLLMKRLEEGVDVRFLIYDPLSPNLSEVARGFTQTEEALRSECDVTVQNLREMSNEWKQRGLPGKLEVRLFSTIPRARIYVFDRKLETGFTYFIPHVDRQNSPNLPGFLVRNIKTGITPAYFEGIERLWNISKSFEDRLP